MSLMLSHALSLSESESLSGKLEEDLLCQVHFSLQLFFSRFQLLCIQWGSRRIALGPWSPKTGFRVAAEVVSFLVEIGGLCSLRFLFCSQFATAVLTTSFASGI